MPDSKITISVIKADIGSVGGHIKPSEKLKDTVREHVREMGVGLLKDFYVSSTGDDIAILMTHPTTRTMRPTAIMTRPRRIRLVGTAGLHSGTGSALPLSDSYRSFALSGLSPAFSSLLSFPTAVCFVLVSECR